MGSGTQCMVPIKVYKEEQMEQEKLRVTQEASIIADTIPDQGVGGFFLMN